MVVAVLVEMVVAKTMARAMPLLQNKRGRAEQPRLLVSAAAQSTLEHQNQCNPSSLPSSTNNLSHHVAYICVDGCGGCKRMWQWEPGAAVWTDVTSVSLFVGGVDSGSED
jgi:hypothetical protein